MARAKYIVVGASRKSGSTFSSTRASEAQALLVDVTKEA